VPDEQQRPRARISATRLGPAVVGRRTSQREYLLRRFAGLPQPRVGFEWVLALARGEWTGYVIGGGPDLLALHDPDPGWVRISDRYVLPARFHALYPLDDVVCAFNLAADEKGVRCHSLLVNDPRGERTITGTLLRKIPVDTLIRTARDLVAVQLFRKRDGSLDMRRVRRPGASGLVEYLKELERKRHHPRRGVQLSDDFLQRVAEAYENAESTGRPPTKTVSVEFDTSRPNASRWVAEARRRGFLPERKERR
jgi:hypothetical protein